MKHVTPPTGEPLDSSGLEAALGHQEAETLLSDLPGLRKQAAAQIDLLIGLLDATEDTDTDTQCDDDPIDDLEQEPSLCGVTVAAKNMRKDQFGDDMEGDAHEDDEDGHDREGDELQHGGDEHDGSEPDADGEPSLGWGVEGETGNESCLDCELAAQPSPETMKKARGRYKLFDRYSANRDGKHVDSEQGFAGRKRLRNLSDRQKEAVTPKLDRDKVSLT